LALLKRFSLYGWGEQTSRRREVLNISGSARVAWGEKGKPLMV